MGWLGLVLVSSMVAVGSFVVSRALGLRRATDLALGTAVLATFQVVATVLAAGLLLRQLHPAVLAGITVAVSGALIALLRRQLPAAADLRLGASRLRLAARPANVGRLVRAHPWESALTLTALAELGWWTLVAYALPPYGWDALWYHLTTVATWVTTGRIGTVPFGLFSNIYPSNFEAVGAWMVTFTHTTTGLTGLELPFALLGALAVMSLARTFDIGRPGAVAAGSIFFLTPVVLVLTTSDYTDLAVAALVLTALALALRAMADRRSDRAAPTTAPLLLLAGIAGGLAIGTKSNAIGYIAALGLILVVQAIATVRAGSGLRAAAGLLALFVVPALGLGSFWYLRIWAHYGNPVYPFALHLAGRTVFSGPMKPSDFITTPPPGLGHSVLGQVVRSWFADLTPWRGDYGFGYAYDTRRGGLGPQWLVLELPLYGAAIWRAVRRRDELLATMVAVPLLGFAVPPYQWWARFSITLVGPGAVLVVLALMGTRRALARTALRAVAVTLVVVSALVASHRLYTVSGSPVSVGRLLHLAAEPPSEATAGHTYLAPVSWIDTLPAGTRIAVERKDRYYDGFYFPLFGHDLQLRPVPIAAGSRAELLATLGKLHASVLATLTNSALDRWARADPSHFVALGTANTETMRRRYGSAYRVML